MAKQEFLTYLRVARNLFAHQRVRPNSPAIDGGALDRCDIWLTPKSVQGFNVADFPELDPVRKCELQTAVQEFLEIATKVPSNKPATLEQVRYAREAFTKILNLLDPYLPMPQEGQQVEEALKRVTLPPWMVSWNYELANDDEGAPAVWINFFVDDDNAPRKELGRFATQLTMQIQAALSAQGSARWPYVRMRTAAEHKKA
jgi:hypothetical protein